MKALLAFARGLIMLMLVFSLGTAMAQSTAFTRARQDPIDENYARGYLFWKDGAGGIEWHSDFATDDPGGPTSSSSSRVDTFVSSPLPETLYVNVSRLVQLNLYFKTNLCPQSTMPIEIHAGEDFFTGSGHIFKFVPEGYPPRSSTWGNGGCVFRARMHAELDIIPKDTALTLRVFAGAGFCGTCLTSPSPQYGFAGDHQSELLVPVYSKDELVYRYTYGPEDGQSTQADGNPEAHLDQSPRLLPVVPVAFSSSLLLLGKTQGRRSSLWIIILTLGLAVSASGCLNHSSDRTQASEKTNADEGIVVETLPHPDGQLEPNLSRVLGVVKDRSNVPVENAHVKLIGYGFNKSMSSDVYGRFSFKELHPGTYLLRVEKSGYLEASSELRLESGRIARVEITLKALEDTEEGFRPHLHDYWGGDTRRVIMDADVDVTGSFCSSSYCYFLVRLPPFVESGPNVVLPGTRNIEITVTWGRVVSTILNDPDLMGIAFISNNDVNATLLQPRPPGVPLNLRANWEMTDAGHQEFTTWQFFLATSGGNPSLNYCSLECGQGKTYLDPIHVRMVLHKGVVPLEPAHADFWRGGTEYVVMEQEPSVANCQRKASSVCLGYQARWNPPRLIPPGTSWLAISVDRSGDSTPSAPDDLVYKPGNVSPSDTGFTYRKAELVDRKALTSRWRIQVSDDESDQFYFKSSNWVFEARSDPNTITFQTNPMAIAISVVANRNPDPQERAT